MLLKHWNLILIFLTFSIISCESSKNEPEVNSTPSFPVGREFNVSLNIAPFLEIAEQPLSRSTSTVADGIYAVNVFWKGKGLTSFQPYASGLFDNPYRVEIGLIEGYVYRFDCSFLGYKDRPYYTIQSDSILYGLPFSSTLQKEVNGLVNNDLKISINPLNINGAFHQHIYKGEMHIKCDSTSTHPTVKRFFGSEQLDFSNPNMNTSVSMTLKRAYYSIQFVTDELAPGDSIKIKAADVAPFYLLYSKTVPGCAIGEMALLFLGFAAMLAAPLPLLLYSLVVCVDSTIRNRSLWIGMLSITASFIQLIGYGTGFWRAWWQRCIRGKDEFEAFQKNFYK